MAINVKTTGSLSANGVKVLVYGQAGAGKTSLIKTLPSPIVLSAEGGLLSIQDADLPFIEIASMTDLQEAYKWLTESDDAKAYKALDAELRKDPAFVTGKEYQKLAAIPFDARKDPRFAKMVEVFLKKHPDGWYAGQAKGLLPK